MLRSVVNNRRRSVIFVLFIAIAFSSLLLHRQYRQLHQYEFHPSSRLSSQTYVNLTTLSTPSRRPASPPARIMTTERQAAQPAQPAQPTQPAQPAQPAQPCPDSPPITENTVSLHLADVTYENLTKEFGHVMQRGGHYAPSTCKSREHVALIIPYRDRERNLNILLKNLIPFLIRQQLEFTIFVVEQTWEYRFNRCLMFNIGYVESQKRGKFTCFILHDTDLIPKDNRNLYRCHAKPRHLVLSRRNEHYYEPLPYRSFIGGALALRKEHMDKCNGCSNLYFGWGLEDDDLGIRLGRHGYRVIRYPMEIGAYYSLSHIHQTENPMRGDLKKTMRTRMGHDGLNSLNYTLLNQQQRELYTWLLVRPPPSQHADEPVENIKPGSVLAKPPTNTSTTKS